MDRHTIATLTELLKFECNKRATVEVKKEREGCAIVADKLKAHEVAAAIRARGYTE